METIAFEVKIVKRRTIRIMLTGRNIGRSLYGYGVATGGALDLPYTVPRAVSSALPYRNLCSKNVPLDF